MDPASLLVTSHYHEGLPEIPQEWLALEYYEDDFNKMADVARSERGVATLHEATGGDASRSAKYRLAMQPIGTEQEALTALRTHSRRGVGNPRALPRARAARVRRRRARTAPDRLARISPRARAAGC